MAVLTQNSHYAQQQQQLQVQSHFPTIPRTLHLYKTGLTYRSLHILDTDKKNCLYKIEIHTWSSPDISLYRPAAAAATAAATAATTPNTTNSILCGSAKLLTFSRTIELQIGGGQAPGMGMGRGSQAPIPFQANGIFTKTRKFESCVGELSWKQEWQDMILLNSREELLATFTHSIMAVSKWGRFELTPRVAEEGGQRLLDEIVLSGVALLEQKRRARARHSNAA